MLPPIREVLKWVGRLLLVLGVFGGLLAFAIALSPWMRGRPSEAPLSSPPRHVLLTESAIQAIAAGDLPRARLQVEEALAEEPQHAPALLLLACLFLEAGDNPEAQEALARLESAAPGRLEAKLLKQLGGHRAHAPAAGWRRAFLLAWTELGRPSFADSPLLPEVALDVPQSHSTRTWERAAATPLRVALVLGAPSLSEAHARWLTEQLPSLEDPALTQAASVALLSAQLPPTLHVQARAVVRRRLAQLVHRAPQVMLPRLLLFWAGNQEWVPLSERELVELEAIATLPTWKSTSFIDTFLEARARLREAAAPRPGAGAFRAALLSNNNWGTVLLVKRAESTRRQLLPGSRQRLGRILWDIGSHLSPQSTVLERLIGLQLMLDGATDLGDETKREHVDRMMKGAHGILTAANQAALERWPLPSLWEEVTEARARDEWAHMREFAGHSLPPD